MSERRAMLETPLTLLERNALVEFTGPQHCADCRAADQHQLCDRCACVLRWEATVRSFMKTLMAGRIIPTS